METGGKQLFCIMLIVDTDEQTIQEQENEQMVRAVYCLDGIELDRRSDHGSGRRGRRFGTDRQPGDGAGSPRLNDSRTGEKTVSASNGDTTTNPDW
jgi:hypothetical protein